MISTTPGGEVAPEDPSALAALEADPALVVTELDVLQVPLDRPLYRAATAVRLKRLGRILAGLVVLLGCAVLVGYLIRNERIVELSPSLPPMYPNAALALACGGIAVLGVDHAGWRRVLAALSTAVLTTIGVVSLALHMAGAGRTWFEALFPTDFVAPTSPVGGRPVVETCVAFVILGSSLALMLGRRAPVVAQALGLSATAVGLWAMVGYISGVDRRDLGSLYIGMALHTAAGITLLGLAVILVRPLSGLLRYLLDGGIAGSMTRRLTLAVVAAPIVLVAFAALAEHLVGNADITRSVFSVLQVALLGALVLVPCKIAVETEQQLRSTLAAARRLAEDADDSDRLVRAVNAEMIVEQPMVPGWEVGMRYEPAYGHLAGDSVQTLHRSADDRTLLAMTDIAGHDTRSAVLAYGLRVFVGALWEDGTALPVVATRAARKMLRRETIATGVLFEFTPGRADVEWVNAGHPPPLLLHRNGRHERLTRTGPLFGLLDAPYAAAASAVERDDLLVMWTDGVEEASSPTDSGLGEDRLIDCILALRDAAPQAIAERCVDLALQHSGGRLADDAMVIVLRRGPVTTPE